MIKKVITINIIYNNHNIIFYWIKNKFKVISLTNKIKNNNSAFIDSEHNIEHTQKDLEYITKKQIEIRLKKPDNK